MIQTRAFSFFILLTIPILIPAQQISPEAIRLRLACESKLKQYLVKGDSLFIFFQADDLAFRMFSSPTQRMKGESEFTVFWDEWQTLSNLVAQLQPDSLLKLYKAKGNSRWGDDFITKVAWPNPPYLPQPNPNKRLLGMKIALDPGHMGGASEMAFWEKKVVKIRKEDSGFLADIEFNEGNLTLGTALILKEKLENEGATVFMTRSKPGETAFGMTYPEWLKKNFPDAFAKYAMEKQLTPEEKTWWLTKAGPEEIFQRLFKNLDLKERARIINEWNPDLTLFIHYNVKESNRMDPQGYIKAVDDNFNMTFIPGAFLDHELDSLESRVNFLRLLAGNDIEQSEQLSVSVLREFQRFTQVPAIPHAQEDSLTYLGKYSIPTRTAGVYARNLALNERVKGVVCFGESLYQDNKNECIRLFSIDYNINGFRVSPRTRDVAEAYFEGILEYVKSRQK